MVLVSDYIKDDTVATFSYCDGEALWYELSGTGFLFPVPFEDTKGAIFKATDKGIFFMKWVRKQLAYWDEQEKMIDKARQEHEMEMARRQEEMEESALDSGTYEPRG